jgi:Tfp pilus assembly PilM family ATPase
MLALEFSDGEARFASASGRGERVVIEQAASVALSAPADDEAPAVTAARWGEQIAAALNESGIGRHETMVAIGRASVELRRLLLPPAPDEELPEMVRFQAMRDFSQLDDDWLLDFAPLEAGGEGPRTVLAAALAPDLAGQIRQTCDAAGLKLARLVLRPCAAASLYARSQPAHEQQQLRLLVDLFSGDADLTAMLDGRAVFLRTARLPADPLSDPTASAALAGEMRRTRAAVENQLGGQKVEAIVVMGAGAAYTALARTLQEAFDLPTTTFDPFAGLGLGPALRRGLPQCAGRYAPLLGMLLDEAAGAQHAMDFLNPRRRPPPPSRQGRYSLIAVAAVALIAAYFGFRWWQRSQLEGELARLTADIKAAEALADQARKLQDRVKEIEKWTSEEVIWLDELALLSENFPPAKEAMLNQLTFGPRTGGGGEVKLEGLAQSEAIGRLHEQARDPRHRITERNSSQDTSQKLYGWKFSASVLVLPERLVPKGSGTPAASGAADKSAGKTAEKPAEKPAEKSAEKAEKS